MLSFLNQNSGTFTVIFSGIVAISTAVYVILTGRLTCLHIGLILTLNIGMHSNYEL